MKTGMYPRIALGSIRKNGRLYIPFFAASILMVAVYYILHFLAYSGIAKEYVGSSTATDMLALGTYIMAVFGTIFLFYTQSALIKGRKNEFGLYSVLGMNRHNLGRIVFFETLISLGIALAGGLTAGIGLSKLAELAFSRMVSVPVNYRFSISVRSVITTVIIYSIIFFLIYLNSLRQVRFTKTIDLINADKTGEKPPKANWVTGILGVVILLAGYFIALRIKQPLSALIWFLIATILVIIGTYLVLIAGSVLLCRILQKNSRFYYRTNHFVSVSSMACRMKRNGAGLASICILLTMILVMISSTSSLYMNSEEALSNHYPNQINAHAQTYGYDKNYGNVAAGIREGIDRRVAEYGAAVTGKIYFCSYFLTGYYENSRLDLELNPLDNVTTIDYDKVVQAYFLDIEDYNRIMGRNETLSPGEVITGTIGNVKYGDEITIGNETYNVTGKIEDSDLEAQRIITNSAISTLIIVVNDLNAAAEHYAGFRDALGEPLMCWNWDYRFDTNLDPAGQIELGKILNSYIHSELDGQKMVNYCESHEAQRGDFYSTFGGLFFLGILLSVIFLVSCVLIIYYKQISEGFEDQARFGIMQKVGMTKVDILKSINSQILTVFLIPIITACIHLAVVLPVIHKLLMLFGFDNMPLLIASAGICALICGIFYAGIYKVTSNAYYRIVCGTEASA